MGSETKVLLDTLFAAIPTADNDKQRVELLMNLKTAMGNLSRAQLAENMNNLNLEVLFACFASDNVEQIRSTCEILKNLMLVLDPVAALDKYHESIALGFTHNVPEVPALIMAHLTRCIEADETSLDKYPALKVAILNQLVAEDLGAAKESDKFLRKYGDTQSGKNYFLKDEAVAAFHALLQNPMLNDSKKFRIYESLTNIAVISQEHFAKLDASLGLMQLLITLSFKSTDVLGQINALEIIANLVGCPHGHEALKNAGVFQEIRKLCDSFESTPHGNILLPGMIKFIGKVGAVSLPEKDMIELVTSTLVTSGKDYSLKTVASEAFAHIGSTVHGKRYLKTLPEIKKYFQIIRELLIEAPTDNKTRGLEAMSILFGTDEANEDCLPHWFNILFHDMSELMEIVRLPFPEIRLAGLNFLASIAHLEWAQRHYLRGPGVIEFLISRAPEPVRECVYAKYRLTKIIAESPTTANILSNENMAQLKLYVHQGPFYATIESSVATASAGP